MRKGRALKAKRRPLNLEARAGETKDAMFRGAVRILQRTKGYRFNLDALLLSDFAAGAPSGPLIDLGTGSGVIPIVLATRYGRDRLTGLELQPRLYQLAQRNVQLNRCEGRIALVLGDLRHVHSQFVAQGFACVVCNPPYRGPAPHAGGEAERAMARHEVACSITDVARAAAYLLRPRGSLRVIFPASRLSDLLQAVHAHRLSPRRLRPVYPRPGAPAHLVLLEASKGRPGALSLLPPLVLQGTRGESSPELARLLE